ncbi:sensor histidine kinase [Streptomyces abyssomicinicus]|uniref:sensor histidine kinase n=1 Tax=Streptomyces abyssomicinicus TaxID=574929 RepID=UPI00124FDD0C|nr:sensor histidine kinase [Streptomyces abyssomicinicus]
MLDYTDLVIGASSALGSAIVVWSACLPGRRRAARELAEALAAAREKAEAAELARQEQGRHWQYAQQVISELECLVERRLPQVVQELEGVRVPATAGLAHPAVFEGTEVAGYLSAAEGLVRGAGDVVRRGVEESARGALRGIAEEVQAALTHAQADIDDGLDDLELTGGGVYAGAKDLRSILTKVDHSVTMGVHSVQRLRILTDSWPGIQRASCTVAEIVESARGRIRHSNAVDYAYHVDTGEIVVDGLIVEPAIVALTELLANATAYSGGTVSVHVQRVSNGIRFSVEDQGLGMAPLQLEEAERSLAAGGAWVTDLAEPGRLGFLVVGRLMSEYGLRAGLAPSAAGGMRADLLVPDAHLHDEAPQEPAAAGNPRRAREREAPGPTPVVPGPRAAMAALSPAAADTWADNRADTWGGTWAGTPPPPTPARLAPARHAGAYQAQTPRLPDPAQGNGQAAPTAPELPVLPKRQPRAPRRHAAPSPQAPAPLPDPETFTADLGRVMDTLMEGYGDGTNDLGA